MSLSMMSLDDRIEDVNKKGAVDTKAPVLAQIPANRHLHEVDRGVNSQFSAIAAALNANTADGAHTAASVRADIVSWLMHADNKVHYNDLLAKFENQKEAHVDELAKETTPGDQVSLTAASFCFQVLISYVSPLHESPHVIGDKNGYKKSICLVHWAENRWDAALPGVGGGGGGGAACTVKPVRKGSACVSASESATSTSTSATTTLSRESQRLEALALDGSGDERTLKSKRAPSHLVVCVDIGAALTKIALLDADSGVLLVRRLFDTASLLADQSTAKTELKRAVLLTGEAVLQSEPASFMDFHHVLLATPGFLKEDGKISFPLETFRDRFAGSWKHRFWAHAVLFDMPLALCDNVKLVTKTIRKQGSKGEYEERVVLIEMRKFTCMNTRAASGYVYRHRHHFEDGVVLTLGHGAGLSLVALERVDVASVAAYDVWLDDNKSMRSVLSAEALCALNSDVERAKVVVKAAHECIKHANQSAMDMTRTDLIVEIAGGMATRLDREYLRAAVSPDGLNVRIEVVDAHEAIWNDTRGLQAFYLAEKCASNLNGEVRFRETEFIGNGAYGRVYKAYDAAKNEVVALKVMNGDLQHYVKAGKKEVDLLLSVRGSKYVSSLIDAFIKKDPDRDALVFCIAMRFYPRSLAKEVEESDSKRLAPTRVMHVARCLLAALTLVHSVPMVHRDVKPDNVLCELDGTAVLADFGVSVVIEEPKAMKVIGTLIYLAPEYAAAHLDGREMEPVPSQDMWALGITLLELLLGEEPRFAMQKKSKIYKELLRSGKGVEGIALHERLKEVGKVPSSLAKLIRKLLEFTPADRGESKALLKEYFKAEPVVEMGR